MHNESLSEIALQFNLTTATLQRLNGITQDRIYPGQRISLQIWSH